MGRRFEQRDDSDVSSPNTHISDGSRGRRMRQSYDMGRYDYEPKSLQARQSERQSRRITVFVSGEFHTKGFDCPFRLGLYCTIEKFLNMCDDRQSRNPEWTKGKAFTALYAWPSCKKMEESKDVLEEEDNIFVLARGKLNTSVPYGGVNKDGSPYQGEKKRGSIKGQQGMSSWRSKNSLMSNQGSAAAPVPRGPFWIKIISNMNRGSKDKILINPQARHEQFGWKDLLKTAEDMLDIPRPPLEFFASCRDPLGVKIKSFNQLFQEYGKQDKNQASPEDGFIVVGMEGMTLEEINMIHKQQREADNGTGEGDDEYQEDHEDNRRRGHGGRHKTSGYHGDNRQSRDYDDYEQMGNSTYREDYSPRTNDKSQSNRRGSRYPDDNRRQSHFPEENSRRGSKYPNDNRKSSNYQDDEETNRKDVSGNTDTTKKRLPFSRRPQRVTPRREAAQGRSPDRKYDKPYANNQIRKSLKEDADDEGEGSPYESEYKKTYRKREEKKENERATEEEYENDEVNYESEYKRAYGGENTNDHEEPGEVEPTPRVRRKFSANSDEPDQEELTQLQTRNKDMDKDVNF